MKNRQKIAFLLIKLNFLANGCILGQNSRKLTPLKIQFYFQDNIAPRNTFLIAWQWHQFDFGVIFTLYCFLHWKFAAKFSNCSHSLNFEAKINCNTTKQNDLKWRKTCTGLKFDLVHFNGPQTKFIRDSLYKHPVFIHRYHLELPNEANILTHATGHLFDLNICCWGSSVTIKTFPLFCSFS